MSTADHADLEALSAFVDGEAPEWADHVAGCEACRGAAARLGALAAAVRAPVAPPAEAAREGAIAAALASASASAPAPAGADHDAHRARFAHRRAPRPWAMPAVAAVVVGLLGLSGVILSSNRSQDESTTFAGPAQEADAGVAAAAPNVPPADLGDVTDPLVLRMRAGFPTGFMAATDPARSVATSSGAASSTQGGASLSVAPPTTTLSQRSATPVPVGTRPCEEQARAREPNLGPVTYFATARRGDVAAYVLGFGDFSKFTLLLLAQNGCGELLRSVGP